MVTKFYFQIRTKNVQIYVLFTMKRNDLGMYVNIVFWLLCPTDNPYMHLLQIIQKDVMKKIFLLLFINKIFRFEWSSEIEEKFSQNHFQNLINILEYAIPAGLESGRSVWLVALGRWLWDQTNGKSNLRNSTLYLAQPFTIFTRHIVPGEISSDLYRWSCADIWRWIFSRPQLHQVLIQIH